MRGLRCSRNFEISEIVENTQTYGGVLPRSSCGRPRGYIRPLRSPAVLSPSKRKDFQTTRITITIIIWADGLSRVRNIRVKKHREFDSYTTAN